MVRPPTSASFALSGPSRAIDRASSSRPQDSGIAAVQAKAVAQRLPVRAQTGRMLADYLAATEMAHTGLNRADVVAAGPQPQPAAKGQLAVAQYQVVAELEQRMTLVEMMGIDTFA
ncbi:MAG: hypothetical protein GXP17_06745 [Gammaproteobacteria bacterium]|nr:hypothetical protein [Gammaproteobacteria bacterium]